MMNNLIPGLILILGSLMIPFLKGKSKNALAIALCGIALVIISQLEPGMVLSVPFLDYNLILLRVDLLSKVFGTIFAISGIAAFIYGWYEEKTIELMSGLLYIGSALGVIFSGDLLSLYLFWEGMAVSSTFLILARKTKSAYQAGLRYILVHAIGGVVLLAGILMVYYETGSLVFNGFNEPTLGVVLILIGFLVNAAAFPISSWMPDAYPEATVMGGVILSAFTSKTAVYALVRGFAGWEILITIGCVMAIYGILYALFENDIRRSLAYCIVNQVGFMVVAVGIGTPLAIAGVAAHAFCHIIYKGLLWMATGSVLKHTGTSKMTELGQLYKTMPRTFWMYVVGALAIGFPLTTGFTSKPIILHATDQAHMIWPWLILEFASVGVFLIAGLKVPYFTFFGKKERTKAKGDASTSMMVAMGTLAALCILLGIFPGKLYSMLPNSAAVFAEMPSNFYDLYIHHYGHVVTKLQLLLATIIAFILLIPTLKPKKTIMIDVDWLYRGGSTMFYKVADFTFNGLNTITHQWIGTRATNAVCQFAKSAPADLILFALNPLWRITGLTQKQKEKVENRIQKSVNEGLFSIGLPICLAIIGLGFFIIIK